MPFLFTSQFSLGHDNDACINQTSPICFNTAVSGQNIITGLWFNTIIGLVLLLLFIWLRGVFRFYQARLVSSDRWAVGTLKLRFFFFVDDECGGGGLHVMTFSEFGLTSVVPEPVEIRNDLSSPHTVQLSPHVERKPPAMKLKGHHRLWSWLKPVFSVPDEELLRSSGLDALVRERERERKRGRWVLGQCL